MKKGNFCPFCGKEEGRFVRGSCLRCFQQKHELIEAPEEIEIEQCKNCGKVRLLGKMLPIDKEQLLAFVLKKVKVKELLGEAKSAELTEKEGGFTATVTVKGMIENVPLILKKDVRIVFKPVLCDACMRLQSNYFEAKVQIRGKDKKAARKALQRLQQLIESQRPKDSLAAVTKVMESRHGFDALAGSSKAASFAVKQLQQEFKAETKRSFKLVGVDKRGKEKKRFTFLLRV